jgi:hypothetical protein
MAVEAALTGDPRLVFQAILHDPLTAAVSLDGGDQADGQPDVRAEPGAYCRSLSISASKRHEEDILKRKVAVKNTPGYFIRGCFYMRGGLFFVRMLSTGSSKSGLNAMDVTV